MSSPVRHTAPTTGRASPAASTAPSMFTIVYPMNDKADPRAALSRPGAAALVGTEPDLTTGAAARLHAALGVLWQRLQSDHSRRGYRQDWADHVAFLTGRGTDPVRATRGDVAAWLEARRERAAKTRSRQLSAVRQVYRAYIEAELRERDPTDGLLVRVPRGAVRTPRLTRAELQALLVPAGISWTAQRDATVLLLAAGTGLRREEIAKLRLSNIAREGAVPRWLRLQVKGRKDVELPLPKLLQTALAAWIAFAGREGDDPLFPRSLTGAAPISGTTVWRAVKAAARRAGIDAARATPHAVRRTFARELRKDGVPLETIRELLGHSSVTVTERYIGPLEIEESPAEVDALLGGAEDPTA